MNVSDNNSLTKDQLLVVNNTGGTCNIEFLDGILQDVSVEFELDGMLSLKIGEGKGERIISKLVQGNIYKIVSGISYLDPYRQKKDRNI